MLDAANGRVVFTPTPGFLGAGGFAFQVSDGLATANGSAGIDVLRVNSAPGATGGRITLDENGQHVFALVDFGFTDADDTLAEVILRSLPGAGALTLSGSALVTGQTVTAAAIAAGDLVFTPAAGQSGTGYASLAYALRDTGGTAFGGEDVSPDATLVFDVTRLVQTAPVARTDAVTTPRNTPIVIAVATLLANDTDAQNDALSLLSVGGAQRGSVVLDAAAGTVTFTPEAGYAGPAAFTYTLSDGTLTALGRVRVLVSPVNLAPVVPPLAASTAENTPITFDVADLLAGANDPEGQALVFNGVLQATNGRVTYSPTANTITFTPSRDVNGAAVLRYGVSDGNRFTRGEIALTITPAYSPPSLRNDIIAAGSEATVVIPVATLLANDRSPDGLALSVTAVASPLRGSVAFDAAAGTITFIGNGTSAGRFTYLVSDGTTTRSAAVRVDFAPPAAPSSAPAPALIAADDRAVTNEDTPVVLTFAQLLANDRGAAGRTITAIGEVRGGSAVLDLVAQTITFTPEANATAAGSFRYTVSDGTTTGEAQVLIGIRSQPDPVVAPERTLTLARGASEVLDWSTFLAGLTPAPGDTLAFRSLGNGAGVIATLDLAAETATLTARANAPLGEVTLTYSLFSGGSVTSGALRVTVTAALAPDAASEPLPAALPSPTEAEPEALPPAPQPILLAEASPEQAPAAGPAPAPLPLVLGRVNEAVDGSGQGLAAALVLGGLLLPAFAPAPPPRRRRTRRATATFDPRSGEIHEAGPDLPTLPEDAAPLPALWATRKPRAQPPAART